MAGREHAIGGQPQLVVRIAGGSADRDSFRALAIKLAEVQANLIGGERPGIGEGDFWAAIEGEHGLAFVAAELHRSLPLGVEDLVRLGGIGDVMERARARGAKSAEAFVRLGMLIVDHRRLQHIRAFDEHCVAAAGDSESLFAEGDLNSIAAGLRIARGRIHDGRVTFRHDRHSFQVT